MKFSAISFPPSRQPRHAGFNSICLVRYQCLRQADGTCTHQWRYGGENTYGGPYVMTGDATGASFDQTTQTPGIWYEEEQWGYPDMTREIHVKLTLIGNSYYVDESGVCREEEGI